MNSIFLKLSSKRRVLVSVLLSLLIVIGYTAVNDSGLIQKAPQSLVLLKNRLMSRESTPKESRAVTPFPVSVKTVPTEIEVSETPNLPTLVPTKTYMTPTPTNKPLEQEIHPGVFSFTDPATNLVHLRVNKRTELIPITITLANGKVVTGYDFK